MKFGRCKHIGDWRCGTCEPDWYASRRATTNAMGKQRQPGGLNYVYRFNMAGKSKWNRRNNGKPATKWLLDRNRGAPTGTNSKTTLAAYVYSIRV